MLMSLLVSFVLIDDNFVPPSAPQPIAVSTNKIDIDLSGQCILVGSPGPSTLFPNKDISDRTGVFPAFAIQQYHALTKQKPLNLLSAKVVLIEGPQHGKLIALNRIDPDLGNGYWFYPDAGYLGTDYMTALVEYSGNSVKVKTKLVVVDTIFDNTEGAPGGYIGGLSGGGAALDKIANDCDFSKVERINRGKNRTGSSS